MRKIRFRVLLLSFLVLLAIFGGLGYFFSYYTTTVVNTKIQEVHLHKAQTYSEELTNLILGDYEVIKDKVERYRAQNPEIKDFLNVILHFEEDYFIKEEGYSVYSLTNDTLLTRFLEVKDPNRLKNNEILLTQKHNLIKNISSINNAYEVYFSYPIEEDYLVFVRDFSPLLERTLQIDEGYYYLINIAGDIICEKVDPSEIENPLFYYLINSLTDNGNVDSLKTEIQGRNSGYQNMRIKGEEQSLFYTPLLELDGIETEDYAFVYLQTQDAILSEVRQIYIFTFVFVVANLIVAISTIIYVFVIVNKRTYEIVISKFSYARAKSFVFTINRKGKIKYMNRALRVKAKGIEQHHNIKDFSHQYDNIFDLIKTGEPFVLNFRTPEDDLYIRFVAFKKKGSYEVVGADVSEEQSEIHDLRKLALYHTLTKLPNKDYLTRDIKSLIKKEPNKKHSLLMFGIVKFRNINRIFGWIIGDQVLVKVKDIVSNILGENEKLYHVGADNFAILKTDVESNNDIIDTVHKLFKHFENPLSVVSNILAIKVKAGVYNFEHKELDRPDFSEYAINNAQLALRKAKESRQLNFASFDISIGQVINREMVMTNDLKEALNKKEMLMYYQPQYDTSNQKIVSFEALMKWTNPKYMNESADKFIRLAEQNGLIIPLGHFVIEETFKVAKRLEPQNIKISINISPVQMLQSGFIRDIESTAKRLNVNPKQISLEITETFMIESFNEVIDKLTLLKDLGFSIHLDDFGTGYSSLLYLKELPINTLKIDKEFIKPIVYDEYSRSIVKHIIDLAQSLDLSVIAEGVETEDQKQFITKSGCRYIQGYLISKAVPEEQIDKLLELHNKK